MREPVVPRGVGLAVGFHGRAPLRELRPREACGVVMAQVADEQLQGVASFSAGPWRHCCGGRPAVVQGSQGGRSEFRGGHIARCGECPSALLERIPSVAHRLPARVPRASRPACSGFHGGS